MWRKLLRVRDARKPLSPYGGARSPLARNPWVPKISCCCPSSIHWRWWRATRYTTRKPNGCCNALLPSRRRQAAGRIWCWRPRSTCWATPIATMAASPRPNLTTSAVWRFGSGGSGKRIPRWRRSAIASRWSTRDSGGWVTPSLPIGGRWPSWKSGTGPIVPTWLLSFSNTPACCARGNARANPGAWKNAPEPFWPVTRRRQAPSPDPSTASARRLLQDPAQADVDVGRRTGVLPHNTYWEDSMQADVYRYIEWIWIAVGIVWLIAALVQTNRAPRGLDLPPGTHCDHDRTGSSAKDPARSSAIRSTPEVCSGCLARRWRWHSSDSA